VIKIKKKLCNACEIWGIFKRFLKEKEKKMFLLFKRKSKKKVVIIGLDGTPYSLLKNLIEQDKLPNMAQIFSQGYFGSTTVCLPEISSVSWTSFMTGTNSGTHGIYGFVDFKPGTYELYFPNFSDLKVPTLFDELGEKGKRSVVINLPFTYPARKIQGVLISGFVAIDLEKAVYPSSLLPKLKKFNYRIDIDTTKARTDHEFLIKDLDETLKIREKTTHYLWENEDWDLFMVVITGTDRLQHFLFDAYVDENHPYHEAFINYYQKIDAFVGRIYEKYSKLKEEKTFFMLSDHGFTQIKTEVYINRWLYENGYLKFNTNKPQMVSDIGPGTNAFALDPSRIYINLKGKYPLGIVDKKDYDKLREELKKAFLEIKYEGDPILREVFFKEELYSGPYLEYAPDLILLSKHGYDLKAAVQRDVVFGRSGLQGMHTYDDAFYFCDKGIKCETIFEIKEKIKTTLL